MHPIAIVASDIARNVRLGLLTRPQARRRAYTHIDLHGVPANDYPDYYLQAFHGQRNGYLSRDSARSYDTGVAVFFLGGDRLMRQTLIRRVEYWPRRVADLGCGTGASTFLLARRFHDADIEGIDLSPFYVEEASRRAARLPDGRRPRFRQGNVEALPYADGELDMVASTFLFHELPVSATRRILREAYRVLAPGKQLAVCDAAQEADTRLSYLFPRLLYEPFYPAYRRMDWRAELHEAGFRDVRIHSDWISKTVFAIKPSGDAGRRT